MANTTRLGLPYPVLAGSANVPADLQALANAIDIAAVYSQGTFAARPAAVGINGRIYWATDTGHLYLSTGTAWIDLGPNAIGPDSITAAMIAADAIGTSELANDSVDTLAIQVGAVTNARLGALAVDSSKVAASLKPSGGAATSAEALRALGTTAGTALAGNDPSVGRARHYGAESEAGEGAAGASNVWTDIVGNCLTTIGEAGDYVITFGARTGGNAAASASQIGLSVNNAAPVRTVNLPFNAATNSAKQYFATLAATDTLRLKHNDNDATRRNASSERFIHVIKVY